MVLFRPEEHEPLVDVAWDEARAHDAIAAIVADAEGALEDAVWPVHPQDASPEDPPAFTTLYLGSAGIVWALHVLGSRLDLAEIVARSLERYRARPDFGDVSSLPMGESGLLLVARLVGSPATDDARLVERIRENRANETWEWLWGSPGTMLAARELGADEAWRESAELLWAEWDAETDLWTQNLYGRVGHYLGPAHGFAANVHALRGFRSDDELRRRVAPVVERTALRDDGLASWPPAPDSRPDELRVQWCHGAPGLVATIGDLMPRELAVGGAEVTWRAGPLVKGPSLCHGTAGNGYALLRAFELTGEELWLDRARRFAMHAIAQVDLARERYGQGRYSLWTGDPGVALYLRSCLDADARVPTMDFW